MVRCSSDGTIECAWHGARFDRRTGDVRRHPATDPLAVFEVRGAGRGDLRRTPEVLMTLAPRADFPLLAAHPELRYLDSAATSQKPRAVLDAIRDYYEHDNANPHRGAYALSVRATDRYHDARERIARFLGVRDAACAHLHARHDGGAQPRGRRRGGARTSARATRSSSRGSSITRTSSPGSSSRSKAGATLRICELTGDGRDRSRLPGEPARPRGRGSSRSTTSRTRSGRSTRCTRSLRWSRAMRCDRGLRRRAERAALSRRLRHARRRFLRVQRPQDAAGRWASAG